MSIREKIEIKNMKKIWARIGTTIPLTDEEYKTFINALRDRDYDKAADIIWSTDSLKWVYDGDSYIPCEPECLDMKGYEDMDDDFWTESEIVL